MFWLLRTNKISKSFKKCLLYVYESYHLWQLLDAIESNAIVAISRSEMEQINSQEKNNVVMKVTGALLFSVLGAMGFFYCLWKHNWNSAVWCLLLEVACTFILVFNKSYLKSELHLKYSGTFFRVTKYVSLFFCVAAWCAFAAYIALGAVKKEVFDVRSHFAASPVALLAGFWFLVLFFDTKKYQDMLE